MRGIQRFSLIVLPFSRTIFSQVHFGFDGNLGASIQEWAHSAKRCDIDYKGKSLYLPIRNAHTLNYRKASEPASVSALFLCLCCSICSLHDRILNCSRNFFRTFTHTQKCSAQNEYSPAIIHPIPDRLVIRLLCSCVQFASFFMVTVLNGFFALTLRAL